MGEITEAQQLLSAATAALAAAAAGAGDAELPSVLTTCETVIRELDRLAVSVIATMSQRGTFAEHGYGHPVAALADLLGWERFEARRRMIAAEQVCDRVTLDGAPLRPRLPATAAVFAAGGCSLRHVETVAKVLGTAAAGRLAPDVWGGAEVELADKTGEYTPSELATWGTALVESLDQDGPEPDDCGPAEVNEVYLLRRGAGGGTLRGRFDDAAMFDAIAAVIDAKAKPLTGDDSRSVPQRQAEALAEVCGWVLDHGDLPDTGGKCPHLNVLIRLEDLQARCRSAVLDFGGGLSPESLRTLACDCAVIPIVMNGKGQPLDVGRVTRTIPDGLRRAVAARDRGCAHPGCNRPPSWCEVHHIRAWEDGGETELSNCVMLCRAHHRLLHRRSGWTVCIRDGLPEFIPPAWIDPDRRPRRKPLPHLAA